MWCKHSIVEGSDLNCYNRFKCQEEPHTLPKLLNAIKWSSHKDVSQVCTCICCSMSMYYSMCVYVRMCCVSCYYVCMFSMCIGTVYVCIYQHCVCIVHVCMYVCVVYMFIVFCVGEIKAKAVLYFPYWSRCAVWKIQYSGWQIQHTVGSPEVSKI